MKFYCGPSRAARREAKETAEAEARIQRLRYLTNWHPCFAIWPARVSENECRWLEYVERRYLRGMDDDGCRVYHAHYRVPE